MSSRPFLFPESLNVEIWEGQYNRLITHTPRRYTKKALNWSLQRVQEAPENQETATGQSWSAKFHSTSNTLEAGFMQKG